MTGDQAIDYIHSLHRFGPKAGLEKTYALLNLLGNPQKNLQCVHIAGTNGKGSTAAMTASILRAGGYKTGLFISPYILEFRERIQINGEMIPPETLGEIVGRMIPLIDSIGGITEFEAVTAAAFVYFAEQDCDAVVLEVGLGGRFDATNVIEKPLVCAITSIGLDHTAILGDTLAQIAAEKAGILKPGAPVVVSAGQDPDAFAVILEQAALKGNTVIGPNRNAVGNISADIFGTQFSYRGMRLEVPLAGDHQITNALTAIEIALELAAHHGYRKLTEQAIMDGLRAVRFPVRMEVLSRDPLIIIDGAHNVAGAKALADALSLLDRPAIGMIGMLSDKDSGEALSLLAPLFSKVICVTPDNPRALPAHSLAEHAAPYCSDIAVFDDLPAAYRAAYEAASGQGCALVVCGSLYLAADMRRLVLGSLPTQEK